MNILNPSYLENYIRIIAFAPSLQRDSFYGVTEFLYHDATIKLLPLLILKRVLSEP